MTLFLTRRRLAKSLLTLAVCAPAVKLLLGAPALADVPALDPSDPTAKALGYVTTSVKPDSKCGNCIQFQGKTGDATGPCTIFPGKSVQSTGWCMSWAKKSA